MEFEIAVAIRRSDLKDRFELHLSSETMTSRRFDSVAVDCYDQWCLRCPAHSRPRRLAWPRTSPFHGGNTGSNPVGDANKIIDFHKPAVLLHDPI
jgi:hypothetical protein